MIDGALGLDPAPIPAGGAATFAGGGDVVRLATPTAANLLFGAGPPTGPFVARGPFLLSTPEGLDAAQRRFARGEMGHLDPSF